MNTKAESFKQFVRENHPDVFKIEELEGDKQEAVVFRSTVGVQGQQLPLMVVIDTSVFTIIRVQICPQALSETDQSALYKFINEQNFSYKPFKFFVNGAGDLMLEICLLFTGEEAKPDEIYLMFEVIINYLNENYRGIMKLIWGGAEAKS